MSLPVKAEDLAGHSPRFSLPQRPKAPPAPVMDPALADAIRQVATALADAKAEQRADIVKAIQVNEGIAAALRTLAQPKAMRGFNVVVKKRDSLGRILEVDFNPK